MNRTDPIPTETLLAHRGFVRRLAHSLLADGSAAEDVAQATWVTALERPPAAVRDPRAWLGGVVRNLARMHARGEAAPLPNPLWGDAYDPFRTLYAAFGERQAAMIGLAGSTDALLAEQVGLRAEAHAAIVATAAVALREAGFEVVMLDTSR